MKGFRFKLQPVLNHRQKKEDILKKELADFKLLFEREKDALELLKGRLAELHNEIRHRQSDRFQANDAAAYFLYSARVEREIEFQLIKLTDIASDVRKAQERLLEATKEKKILEKLHEKKLEEYKGEFDRVEQALIDEISTVRYNRADV